MLPVNDGGRAHAGPTIYEISLDPGPGRAMMSYGPSMRPAYRQLGVYAGRTLMGETSAALPGKLKLIS